jgi:hypothetical protein
LDIEAKADELTKEIGPVLAVAGEIVVRDAASYRVAGETWKELTGLEKRVKAYWEDDVESARNLHKSLVAKRDAMLVPVGERKNALRLGMKAFEDEQERARRAAQEAAEAEARRIAEEAALARAVELERNGNKAAAEAVMAAPVVAAPVVVEKTVPAGFGAATRRTWSAEVFDLIALAKAAAEGKVSMEAIEPNTTFLNGMARALKGALAIPGVKAVEK